MVLPRTSFDHLSGKFKGMSSDTAHWFYCHATVLKMLRTQYRDAEGCSMLDYDGMHDEGVAKYTLEFKCPLDSSSGGDWDFFECQCHRDPSTRKKVRRWNVHLIADPPTLSSPWWTEENEHRRECVTYITDDMTVAMFVTCHICNRKIRLRKAISSCA